MSNNRMLGAYSEKVAINELIKKGYTILEHNYYGLYGEIDIIAYKDEYIIFIEVKSRRNISKGMPYESVTLKKQKKIILTAMEYVHQKQIIDCNFRFDVIEILYYNNKTFFKHIKNAFYTEY